MARSVLFASPMAHARSLSLLLASLAAFALGPLACAGGGSATDEAMLQGAGAGSSGTGVSDPGCEGPLGPPRDPGSLPACCPDYGGAHCIDGVPPELGSFVSGCDSGGYCVPDDFIATGGVFTPASCTSMSKAPGVCLSVCIPEVAQYIGLLPQDVCKDSERCVPCVSPLDNTTTGACDLSFTCGDAGGGGEDPPPPVDDGDDPTTCEHEGDPVLDPAGLPACPSACAGHCLSSALVPADQAASLASCDGGALCVPDELIVSGGEFLLDTCESIAGVEGRCVSTCLPEVIEQMDLLPQSTCASTHRCVPCYDPLSGDDTGACRLSCDPGPTDPPTQLPACCGGLGTCVPSGLVPADQSSQLGVDECPADQGLVCAPSALVPGLTPVPGDLTNQPCETSFLFQLAFGFDAAYKDGVCLPTCIPEVGDAPWPIGDGSCDDDRYNCIPCNDPQNGGASTGACN